MKVLLLPTESMLEALGHRRESQPWAAATTWPVLDPGRPLEEQFAGVEAILDQGGSASTRAMMDAAVSARLWQILGTGFDHFDLEYVKSKGIPVANHSRPLQRHGPGRAGHDADPHAGAALP